MSDTRQGGQTKVGDPLLEGLLAAVVRSIDESKLEAELAAYVEGQKGGGEGEEAQAESVSNQVLRRIVLADLLDESILEARPGDAGFGLRLFFGHLGVGLCEESAFTLASGLNFYFRAEMDEEARVRLGLEVSRQYYRFVREASLSASLVAEVSPQLASLMSGELERLRFESVDHEGVFDSSVHERAPEARPESAVIARPASFLCRVTSNGAVRIKARVVT